MHKRPSQRQLERNNPELLVHTFAAYAADDLGHRLAPIANGVQRVEAGAGDGVNAARVRVLD